MMNNEIALITGASSGIGKAFAFRYAKAGCDLILIARSENALKQIAENIRNNYRNSVEIISSDLSIEKNIEFIENKLTKYNNISILVNNAGFGLEGKFSETPIEKLQKMINLHVTAVTRLTRAVLPSMIKNNRGTIINVSSLSAIIAMPDNLLYSATKSFINTFSEHLKLALKGKKINVQSLCPSFTKTEFYNTDEYKNTEDSDIPNFMWMTAEQVVDKSLNALRKGTVVFVPGSLNQIAARFNKLTSLIIQKMMK
jgi:short-subunit dehydrogenase